MGAPLTLNLDDATRVRLEEAAAARDISAEALAKAALEMFLSDQELAEGKHWEPWQRELIRQGVEDAERGHFASEEEVERLFKKYRD